MIALKSFYETKVYRDYVYRINVKLNFVMIKIINVV